MSRLDRTAFKAVPRAVSRGGDAGEKDCDDAAREAARGAVHMFAVIRDLTPLGGAGGGKVPETCADESPPTADIKRRGSRLLGQVRRT